MSHTDVETDSPAAAHLYTTHDSIPYGIAARLRDHDALPDGAVAEGAAAYTRYVETSADEAVAVHPDGFATAVHLASMKMKTIALDVVPQDVLTAPSTETELASYTLLVFGRPSQAPNHAIQEYC